MVLYLSRLSVLHLSSSIAQKLIWFTAAMYVTIWELQKKVVYIISLMMIPFRRRCEELMAFPCFELLTETALKIRQNIFQSSSGSIVLLTQPFELHCISCHVGGFRQSVGKQKKVNVCCQKNVCL